ncbi:hypothetical protein OF83DRAFT_1089076 [Amylostereum chailletii]|nr:hypothetical protein OF83DRAFT_1089076 [Amylostereum chailletii]
MDHAFGDHSDMGATPTSTDFNQTLSYNGTPTPQRYSPMYGQAKTDQKQLNSQISNSKGQGDGMDYLDPMFSFNGGQFGGTSGQNQNIHGLGTAGALSLMYQTTGFGMTSMHNAPGTMSVNISEWRALQEMVKASMAMYEEVKVVASEAKANAASSAHKVVELGERIALVEQRESLVGPIRTKKSNNGGRGREVRNTALENRIHEKMQMLIGIQYSGHGSNFTVPPPPDDLSKSHLDDHGNTVWTPDWRKDAKVSMNKSFIDHAVALLERDDTQNPDEKERLFLALDAKERRVRVAKYFGHICNKYKGQTDINAKEKAVAHSRSNELRRRRQRIAADMRKACPVAEKALEEKFGPGSGKGISLLIDTDYVYSCHSNIGDAEQATWDQHKIQAGIGAKETAWEVRRRLWVAQKLRRLYQFLVMTKRGIDATSKKKGKRTPIFRGLKANHINTPPLVKTLWKECVSDEWLAKYNEKCSTTLTFPNCTAEQCPVLNIDIHDDMFTDEDLAWLADDEDDAEEEEEEEARDV